MITRKFFNNTNRRVTRHLPKKYPMATSWLEIFWAIDCDYGAVFIVGKEECLGEYPRSRMVEYGWL